MATSSESEDKDRPDTDDTTGDADGDAAATKAEDGGDAAATKAEDGGDAAAAKAKDGDERRADAAAPEGAAKRAKGAGAGKRGAGKKAAARARPPAQPQGGSLGKSMILFLIIIGSLAGAFAYFGREPPRDSAGPKWKAGDKPQVEITLVASDIKDLACWSATEINGRHCAFEAPTKGWSKGDADDQKLLRPYTTTDRVQFLAAGLWSQPALTGTLPSTRFAVKCTYNVEGTIKRPGIRWSSDAAWIDRSDDWYTGLLSDCKLVTP